MSIVIITLSAFISFHCKVFMSFHCFAGLPDPSVEVTLGAHKEKTKTMMKTTSPAWANEVQRIPIMNWELPNLLTLRVISKSKTYIGRQMELGYVPQSHA
jgi:hypothetical protein